MLWTLKVKREGLVYTVVGRHLILSTGPGGTVPIQPEYPDRDLFEGVVLHSNTFTNASGWKGKKGLVIGTANTGGPETGTSIVLTCTVPPGHDVAEDMLHSGLSTVTMAQRGKTCELYLDASGRYA